MMLNMQQKESDEFDRRYLEENFSNLSTITVLDLSSKNQKTKIKNETFKSLTQLEKIFLHINRIQVIETRAFVGLSNLKILLLQTNRIKEIKGGLFKSLANLEVLELGANLIEAIDSDVFEGLVNLKDLRLYENKLKKIDNQTFKPLVRLEFLDINNNQIETIESSAFDGLSNLKQLYLACNKLNNLDRSCFRYFNSIGFVELVYNKFDTKIVSYFNKKVFLKWNPDHRFPTAYFYQYIYSPKRLSISEFESSLSKISPFTSNFKDFLNQFAHSSEESFQNWPTSSELNNYLLNNASWKDDDSYSEAKSSNEDRVIDVNELDNLSNFMPLPDSPNDSRVFVVQIDDPFVGITLKDYFIIEPLGKGAFGQVYLVDDQQQQQNSNQSKKAMKIMDLSEVAQNETSILKAINHENIVKYLDHFEIETSRNPQRFSKIKLCIVTEFCEKGDLRRKINEQETSHEKFGPSEILAWIFEATCGLKYLHSLQPKGIIHRDIKPENMLLSNDSVIKLADLGLSRLTRTNTTSVYTVAGTREYMSPEMYRCILGANRSYSFKTDIWSLGCVLYELISLTKAFPKGQESDPAIPNLEKNHPFSHLLEGMLKKDDNERFDSTILYNELMKTKKTLDLLGL